MARSAGTKCPTCGRLLARVPAELRAGSFCSERCRSIDLGNWLDGAYRISAPVEEEDLDHGMPTDGATHKAPDKTN